MDKIINKITAFTLAEVLITLAIIGIVSALVIPSVLKNYNDKKYNTARLKALKTFGEAGKMASINGEINGQPTARAFVENVLSKYLKITKVCDTADECGFPDKFRSLSYEILQDSYFQSWYYLNTAIKTKNNWTAKSETGYVIYVATVDGLSAKLFYNPKCVRNSHENPAENCSSKECPTYALDDTCINVIYDMNGIKAPNHIGEDMGFVTVFWSGLNATSVAPDLISYDKNRAIYNEGTKTQTGAQALCALNGYSLPSIDELSSFILNLNISSIPSSGFWSGTSSWGVNVSDGLRYPRYNDWPYKAWCVRR